MYPKKKLVVRTPCFSASYPQGVRVPRLRTTVLRYSLRQRFPNFLSLVNISRPKQQPAYVKHGTNTDNINDFWSTWPDKLCVFPVSWRLLFWRVYLAQCTKHPQLWFGSKFISSFSMSAIYSFLKYLRYRQTQTSRQGWKCTVQVSIAKSPAAINTIHY